jgi:hypothetical protein
MSMNETQYRLDWGPDAPEPIKWYWLWNDALYQACERQGECGLGRVPIWFNDGWGWSGNGQAAMYPCNDDGWLPGIEIPVTMRTLWTWHARLGQYDAECVNVTRNTLIGSFRRRVNHLLSEGLDMNGRDLYPGTAFVGR